MSEAYSYRWAILAPVIGGATSGGILTAMAIVWGVLWHEDQRLGFVNFLIMLCALYRGYRSVCTFKHHIDEVVVKAPKRS